jgi:hypothetical protein
MRIIGLYSFSSTVQKNECDISIRVNHGSELSELFLYRKGDERNLHAKEVTANLRSKVPI